MKEKDVVIDQKLITATGVGTAVKFALALIEVLINSENARATADSIHAPFKSIYN
jgi:transcriptional regulator GlxA family with amidase domain